MSKNTTLFELLKELSGREWNAFEDFVNSPTFNKSEQIRKTLKVLKDFWPDFADENQIAARLSQKLFPQKDIGKTAKNISNLTTRLLRLLEQFLAFQYWKKDENKQDNDFLRSLVQLHKDDLLKLYLEKIEKKREKQTLKSIDFYDSKFVFLEQKHRHSLNKKLPTKWANLQDISDSLDEAYILKKLKYACIIGKREQIYKGEHQIGMLDELLQYIEAKKLCEKNESIAIYYTCFELVQKQEAAIAEKFANLLKEKGNILPKGELATLYEFLSSYYNRQTVKQYDKMLDIYRSRLDYDLLFNGKYLHYTHLYNVLILMLKNQEFAEAKNFAEAYKEKIEPKFAKTFKGFCLALSAFYEENYGEASKHFEQLESSTLSYELKRRTYLLKIYFLTNEEWLFEAKISNFTQLLHDKKKMPKNEKAKYLHFIKIIHRFFKAKDLRNKTDKDKLKRLEQKIKKLSVLWEKKWLLQQIEIRLK